MKITVVGTGYVGLVSGACFADIGHHVTCVDKDREKILRLRHGQIDIYEPALAELVEKNLRNQHLSFTCRIQEGLQDTDVIFITVGTPSLEHDISLEMGAAESTTTEIGTTDLSHVMAVAESIGLCLNHEALVVIKSTVPVGTCHRVEAMINSRLAERARPFSVAVISNPEFLKEGAAVNDFTRPDRIIIGAENPEHIAIMRDIYAPFNRRKNKILVMDVSSAELSKYAANAMLATKISFMNEIANIAESIGADIESVRQGIGSDPRIGYDFIYAGCGYGGSCFPKDIKSLINTAAQVGYPGQLLRAVDRVNEQQKHILFAHLQSHFQGNLAGKVIAVWGLSFKPETNDIREAPSCTLMESLWKQQVKVQAYDPVAMSEIDKRYGQRDDLKLTTTKEEALCAADALVICTEWKEFRIPDYRAMKSLLKNPVIVDGRNLYEPECMIREGFHYYGVGRGRSCRSAVKTIHSKPLLRIA